MISSQNDDSALKPEDEGRAIDQLKVVMAQRNAGQDRRTPKVRIWNRQSLLTKSGIVFVLVALPGLVAVSFGISVPILAWIIYLALAALTFGVVMTELYRQTFGEKPSDNFLASHYGGSLFVSFFLMAVILLSATFARWLYGP